MVWFKSQRQCGQLQTQPRVAPDTSQFCMAGDARIPDIGITEEEVEFYWAWHRDHRGHSLYTRHKGAWLRMGRMDSYP